MGNGGVCRTAPATPGLLKTEIIVLGKQPICPDQKIIVTVEPIVPF